MVFRAGQRLLYHLLPHLLRSSSLVRLYPDSG
jgi:hypothetical protein